MYMFTFGPLHLRSFVIQLIPVEHHSNFIKVLLRSYTYIYVRIVILYEILRKLFEVKIGGRIRVLRDLCLVMLNAQS